MAMRFPYKLKQYNHPILPLGGRFVRPRPVVTASLVGPMNTWAGPVLLDTGADDSVFHEDVARSIGLDLTGAPPAHAAVASRGRVPLRYAQVVLRLTDGHEHREWPGWVGFTPVTLVYPCSASPAVSSSSPRCFWATAKKWN